MHADNRRIDHLHGYVMRGGQCVHNPAPGARPSPANEAIVAGGVRAKGFRQIAPRCSGAQDAKDALSTRLLFTRGTPRGLFGRNGLMAAHS